MLHFSEIWKRVYLHQNKEYIVFKVHAIKCHLLVFHHVGTWRHNTTIETNKWKAIWCYALQANRYGQAILPCRIYWTIDLTDRNINGMVKMTMDWYDDGPVSCCSDLPVFCSSKWAFLFMNENKKQVLYSFSLCLWGFEKNRSRHWGKKTPILFFLYFSWMTLSATGLLLPLLKLDTLIRDHPPRPITLELYKTPTNVEVMDDMAQHQGFPYNSEEFLILTLIRIRWSRNNVKFLEKSWSLSSGFCFLFTIHYSIFCQCLQFLHQWLMVLETVKKEKAPAMKWAFDRGSEFF